jgi:hypothetical protein
MRRFRGWRGDVNEPLSTLEPWIFTATTVCLFGLFAFLSYQKKIASAFVVLLGVALSGGFLYLDHISEIAATATSLTIKVREASDALIGLRKVAALTGSALINLDAQSGTLGGDSANHRDQLREQVLETLRSIGVDEATMKQVGSESRNRDISDYVWGIISHVGNCVLAQTRQSEWMVDVQKGWQQEWPPSPDHIQNSLEKYGVHDDFTTKALDEYRYFLRTDEHRDVQFWHDRDSWPTVNSVANPDSKQKCQKP